MESTVERKDECVKETCHHGIQMSEEELESYFQDFQDIEIAINNVMENGEDL